MTPTLAGRLQTRVVLAATVGLVWMAGITPLLPHGRAQDMGMGGPSGYTMNRFMLTVPDGARATLAQDERMALATLGLMTLLGLAWECGYHLLQQCRWDRDWPPAFVLLSGIPEGALLWAVLREVGVDRGGLWPPSSVFPMFALLFASTWVVLLLTELGPMRVVAPHWRFRGMEVIGRRRPVPAGRDPSTAATAPARQPVGRSEPAPD